MRGHTNIYCAANLKLLDSQLCSFYVRFIGTEARRVAPSVLQFDIIVHDVVKQD